MQVAIDIGIILLVLGAIALLLKELARSQRNSEPEKKHEFTYTMNVRFKSNPDLPPVSRSFAANSLAYMQENLNMLPFHAITSAEVRTLGVPTHRMDATGVLREFP